LNKVQSDTRGVLEQLTKELEAYGNLDTKTQKKWDALRWGMKDISDIKLRLIAITTNLSAFSSAITKYVTPPIYSSQHSRAYRNIPFYRTIFTRITQALEFTLYLFGILENVYH
jgi:hypothetical protein